MTSDTAPHQHLPQRLRRGAVIDRVHASPTTTHSSHLSTIVKTVTAQLNTSVNNVASIGKKTPTAHANGGKK
jgi:hypothetical protein